VCETVCDPVVCNVRWTRDSDGAVMDVAPAGCVSTVNSTTFECSEEKCRKQVCPTCSVDHEAPAPCSGYTAEVHCDEPQCSNNCDYPDVLPEMECELQCEKPACEGRGHVFGAAPVVTIGGAPKPTPTPAGVSAAWKTASIVVSVVTASLILVVAVMLIAMYRRS